MPELPDGGDWGLLLGISAAEFAARSFSADLSGLQHARHFARDVLDEWGLSPYIDDIVTVIGELIANAALHALRSTDQEDTAAIAWLGLVRRHQAVICAVADPSPCTPKPQHPEQFAESGRGLQIVKALSLSWGCSPPQSSGKMVWARVPTPPQP